MSVTWQEAMKRLEEGNRRYVSASKNSGDVSENIRIKTAREGQHPYAVILACSDSRVVPEHIFDAGIGELFTVRTAGNTADKSQLGSIEYGVSHLGCRLVVVLGHTNCGAVGATLSGGAHGNIGVLTDLIKSNIGNETGYYEACVTNVRATVKTVSESLEADDSVKVIGAMYDTETGETHFLD